MSEGIAITATGLTKVYPGGKKALDGLDLSIDRGEIFGFLGPNGAGKTTTVKLLVGVLAPTEGTGRVLELSPHSDAPRLHGRIGVLTEHAQMYDPLTGLENLVFYAMLYGLDKREARIRAMTLLDALSLSDAKDRKLGAYSTGMRQRLSFARALVHKPAVLFLDEPTSGLDPESAQSVNDTLKTMAAEEGVTVFLCTHQLRYAEALCTSYGMLDEGTLYACGSLDALRGRAYAGTVVRLGCDRLPDGIKAEKAADGRYEIEVADEADIPALVSRCVAAGVQISHVSQKQLSLEDVYFTLLSAHKARKGSAS